jgi:membrane associated rhomboid family serine protease
LLVTNVALELLLQLADHGVAGPVWLRPLVYRLATFQRDLAGTGGPLFPGQTLLMFFTYGFVHTGLLHLTVNMIGLVWLGRLILAYRTTGTFVIFYLMAMVGAAEVFALIGPEQGAIAGASGALFGLLGVYVADSGLLTDQRATPQLWLQIMRLILATLILALSDMLSQQIMGSTVAWQAHAGGFFTGALVALAAPPRYR